MNGKISMFVICVEAIIYLLLYNLHACTFNLNRIVHTCIIYFCSDIKLKKIIFIIWSRKSKYQNYIVSKHTITWQMYSDPAACFSRFLLQILKSTLLFWEQLRHFFRNQFSHVPSKVNFHLFWYLVKLLFSRVVELIPFFVLFLRKLIKKCKAICRRCHKIK